MAIAVCSSSLMPGRNLPLHCQSCNAEDITSFGWKISSLLDAQRNKLGTSKQFTCYCAFGGSHSFGLPDSLFISREKMFRLMRTQVAADYSDSKSGAFRHHGEIGYHPLEEINDDKNSKGVDLRLSDAEIARSTVEANNNAIIVLPGMVLRESYEESSLTDLQYVIDDYGDIYFELNDDENILRSPRARNPVNVFVGLDDLQIYGEQKRMVFEYYNSIHSSNSSETNNEDDFEEDWSSINNDGNDLDHSESVKDWAKVDTLTLFNPVYFAKKMTKVVFTNHLEKMERPSNGVAIIGLLRPALLEEESFLRKYLYDTDYSSGDVNYRENDQLSNGHGEETALTDEGEDLTLLENISDSKYMDVTDSSQNTDDSVLMSIISPEDEESWELVSERDDELMNSSFYKLDILSVRLMSVYGNQSIVNLEDFQQAEPDILANSSLAIIAHFNAGGGKTTRALKALCRKKKGLDVEEATLIGVDSLGVDIRVHSGTEVQTVRIAFNCPATSESAAKRQLQRLLFPYVRYRRQRPRRECYRDK